LPVPIGHFKAVRSLTARLRLTARCGAACLTAAICMFGVVDRASKRRQSELLFEQFFLPARNARRHYSRQNRPERITDAENIRRRIAVETEADMEIDLLGVGDATDTVRALRDPKQIKLFGLRLHQGMLLHVVHLLMHSSPSASASRPS
jgi:hypothetical protein